MAEIVDRYGNVWNGGESGKQLSRPMGFDLQSLRREFCATLPASSTP
jgi:hypothetical protein